MKLKSFVSSYILVSIYFSLRRLEHLYLKSNKLYGRGMTSKGKQCQTLKQEAVVKTGLPIDVITNWIGNHRKTFQQKKYAYPKTLYERE